MNYIDLLAEPKTRLSLAQVNRLPRIKGKTCITAKTHSDALALNGLARESRSSPAGFRKYRTANHVKH